MSHDFLRRLRALDETFAGRPVPGRVQARMLERVREAHTHRRARRWTRQGLALGFVAGAVATAFMLRAPATPGAEPVRPTLAPAVESLAPEVTIAGLTLTSLPCAPSREADVVVLPAACRLSGQDLEVSTLGPARLAGTAEHLRVVSGDVHFDVEHRPSAAPLMIAVSGGVIEVVGTRFSIHEDGARGHVELYEGRLRFVAGDGAVRFIEPGQRHVWGDVRESSHLPSEAPPEQVAPRRKASRQPGLRSAEEALEVSRRVTAHRHRGAHAEAARELAEALRAGRWPRTTAEVWSYELGTLYADELGDRATACAHWLEHARHFGDGAYAAAVAASTQQLKCEP